MKRKDIRPGVLYGLDGYNGGPQPVMFPDGAQTLWLRDKIGRHKLADPKAWRASRADSCGYAAVRARDPEFLRMLDPDALMDMWRGGGEPPAGAHLILVTVMAGVLGEYEESRAAWKAKTEQDRIDGLARDQEFRSTAHRMSEVITGLTDAGVPAGWSGARQVSIGLDDAERLLAVLREKQES